MAFMFAHKNLQFLELGTALCLQRAISYSNSFFGA